MLEHAYIGFGANLGDRFATLTRVTEELQRRGLLLRVATVVESEPVDGVPGGNFLNTVFECSRAGNPRDCMLMLQAVERVMGAQNDKHGGARTCDLDILLWGNDVIELPDLRVPHPRMHLRDFYLAPLNELIGGERHPVLRKTFSELLADVELHSIIVTF